MVLLPALVHSCRLFCSETLLEARLKWTRCASTSVSWHARNLRTGNRRRSKERCVRPLHCVFATKQKGEGGERMEGGRKQMTEEGMEACRQASSQRAEVTEHFGDFVISDMTYNGSRACSATPAMVLESCSTCCLAMARDHVRQTRPNVFRSKTQGSARQPAQCMSIENTRF